MTTFLLKTLAVVVVGCLLSACGGAGLRLEGYRIDETQTSHRTYARGNGMKCWFSGCFTNEAPEDK